MAKRPAERERAIIEPVDPRATAPERRRRLRLRQRGFGPPVGLFGAVAGFFALAVTGLATANAWRSASAYAAMEVIAWMVIAPLAFAALITGVIQSLGTPWGLFRHWWVVVKLLDIVFVIGVLLVQMESISHPADVAATGALSGDVLRSARSSLVVHAGGGLVVLILPLVLSIYKPRGLTGYGWRKQPGRRAVAGSD